MCKNEPRGFEDVPHDRSIAPRQPAHVEGGVDKSVQSRTAVTSRRRTVAEYRFSEHGTTQKYAPISPADVDDVYVALAALLDGSVRYVDWTDISQMNGDYAVDFCGTSISRALGLLAQDEDCPVVLERWSGPSAPTTWRVTPPEDDQPANAESAVTDDGERHER